VKQFATVVMPAKAGIQCRGLVPWIPDQVRHDDKRRCRRHYTGCFHPNYHDFRLRATTLVTTEIR